MTSCLLLLVLTVNTTLVTSFTTINMASLDTQATNQGNQPLKRPATSPLENEETKKPNLDDLLVSWTVELSTQEGLIEEPLPSMG